MSRAPRQSYVVFGVDLGGAWGQFGGDLGSIWGGFGVDLRPIWGQFFVKLECGLRHGFSLNIGLDSVAINAHSSCYRIRVRRSMFVTSKFRKVERRLPRRGNLSV